MNPASQLAEYGGSAVYIADRTEISSGAWTMAVRAGPAGLFWRV